MSGKRQSEAAMTLLGLGKAQHSHYSQGSSGSNSLMKQGAVPLGQPAEADKKKPNLLANLMMKNMKKVPEKVEEEEKDEEKKEEECQGDVLYVET